MAFQEGILALQTPQARFVHFALRAGVQAEAVAASLQAVQAEVDGQAVVLGLGAQTCAVLGQPVPGLPAAPVVEGSLVALPAAPVALWLWLRGEDRGKLLHEERRLAALLAPAFVPSQSVEGFMHRKNRDLTGYEDGTENPKGEEAVAAAFVADGPLAGSSFVAIQQWQHDFAAFAALGQPGQDLAIGRRIADNEEIEDAPETAHVKRTEQEGFEPEAFVLRRSMPWAEGGQAGLMFLAFGHSTEAFDVQMRRMSGAEDGIVDALFDFSQVLGGAYAWCPAMHEGKLDLRPVGL